MIKAFQEINFMKASALGTERLYETPIPEPGSEAGTIAAAEEGSKADAEFGMTFTVPKVCLTLKTRKKALSKKIHSQSTEWELLTELE